MELFGIRFVPLNESLERHLQTFAAATWMVTLIFGGPIGLIFSIYLILYTRFWWITSIYLFYIWTFDKDVGETGGRPNKWVAKWWVWKYNLDYFPLDLVKVPSVELDPKKNYLFCAFPHGMISSGAFNFGCEWSKFRTLFPNHESRMVTLSQHYWMPFLREIALSFGGIASSARSIESVLSKPEGGYVCTLMVGGASEAYFCKPGNYKVVLRNRKGFVKLALRNGAPLVPVIFFGETDLYDQVEHPLLRVVQEKIRKLVSVAPVVPIGRGFFQLSFGMIPRRRPVTVVVGHPLEVPRIAKPTNEEIDEYHEKFVKSLIALFDEQKHNYLETPEEKHLVIT